MEDQGDSANQDVEGSRKVPEACHNFRTEGIVF